MFGEYGIFYNGKMCAVICDNKLFFKPTVNGRKYLDNVVEAPPFPGAKSYFLIEDDLENRSTLTELLEITVDQLPIPKEKSRKKKK